MKIKKNVEAVYIYKTEIHNSKQLFLWLVYIGFKAKNKDRVTNSIMIYL